MESLIRRTGTHGADISFHDNGVSLQATLLFLCDDGTIDMRMRVTGTLDFVKEKLSDHLNLWDSRAESGISVQDYNK